MPSHSSVLWAILLAAVAAAAVGVWALRLQALQARDIVRKHDIEDLEQALMRYGLAHGTYPPDASPTWCGTLAAQKDVRTAVEASLRRDEKYAKADKPFPSDPRFSGTARDYFYWKTSPVSFELLAELEADASDDRDTSPCSGTIAYDYSVVSTLRNAF